MQNKIKIILLSLTFLCLTTPFKVLAIAQVDSNGNLIENSTPDSSQTIPGVRNLSTPAVMPILPNTDVVNSATGSTVESIPATGTKIINTLPNNSLSLTAIPPRLGDDYSLTLKPGEKRQVMVEIRNPSTQNIKVISSTKDFILGGEDGETPIPVDDSELSGKWSLASWLTLDGTTRSLEPKQSAQIPVLISVPADAVPGGHYAMILHRPTTDQSLETTGSQINTQIGTLVYVIVDGPMNESLNIIDFKFDAFAEKGPINYRFTVSNDSSYHTRPEGAITINNLFGKKVAELPITTNKNIFPDTKRQYAGTWNTGWGFGPYQATIALKYGQDMNQTTAINTFWILPVRFIILFVLIIIVVIVIVSGMKKKQTNKSKKNQPKTPEKDKPAKTAAPVTDDNSSNNGPNSHYSDNDVLA